jgi:hypothetical protein
MNEPTQTGAGTAKRGRPPGSAKQAGEGTQQAGEGTQTTGSSGNARRGHKRLTLTDRVRAMESNNGKLIRLADQIKQIARGVS